VRSAGRGVISVQGRSRVGWAAVLTAVRGGSFEAGGGGLGTARASPGQPLRVSLPVDQSDSHYLSAMLTRRVRAVRDRAYASCLALFPFFRYWVLSMRRAPGEMTTSDVEIRYTTDESACWSAPGETSRLQLRSDARSGRCRTA